MEKIKLRAKLKRKKPSFRRSGDKTHVRVKTGWRRPRGNQSKLRKHKKARGFLPRPGYGSPKEVKNLHPSGFEDILIYTISELEKLDAKTQACRIASKVGKRKGLEIMKKAAELKIKVLNPIKQTAKKEKAQSKEVKKIKDKKEEKKKV
ncbi:MAG: 50S ribosomal protein L32e [Candidatus Aenigmarchaeota archaeon]|nr:50S ribosomal protein L32e [Candidatus Aenigmarchaeota archaeon]